MILSWIVFLGATVRIPVIMNSSFPANDGGMFMQAIVQLKANHFVLPMYLHYNGLTLPYAYPPIGFYLAGILSSVTHMSVLNTLRFIPLTFSVATIVAFILFANAFLKNRAMVIAATLAFALVPNGHEWEIMGGGLTRSIGFFFAVLALWQMYLLFTERSRTHLLLTIVFASLVCMSHLEMALFVAVSADVMILFLGTNKARGIRRGAGGRRRPADDQPLVGGGRGAPRTGSVPERGWYKRAIGPGHHLVPGTVTTGAARVAFPIFGALAGARHHHQPCAPPVLPSGLGRSCSLLPTRGSSSPRPWFRFHC